MNLTFDAERVRTLIEHTKANPTMLPLYGEEIEELSLVLVGDHGVYLMAHTTTPLENPEGDPKMFVVYANEVNPYTMEFDAWWDAKRASFGGDDGVCPVAIDLIEGNIEANERLLGRSVFEMYLTPTEFRISHTKPQAAH